MKSAIGAPKGPPLLQAAYNVTDQVPSKVVSVEAVFVFCANRSVETANTIVIRDAYFISIPNLTNRNTLISPSICANFALGVFSDGDCREQNATVGWGCS
jgi:hypothetical protein